MLIRFFVFGFLFLFIIGCTTSLSSQRESLLSLSKYKNFNLACPIEDSLTNPWHQLLFFTIYEATKNALIENGWEEDRESPLFINVGITSKITPQDTVFLPSGAYPVFITPRYCFDHTDAYTLQIITEFQVMNRIVFEFVDLKNNKHLFYYITETFQNLHDPDLCPFELVENSVTNLFRQIFPK